MIQPLLPCPFCGGSALIEQYGDARQSTIYRCDNCSCSLETGEEWDHGRLWNARAALSSHTSALAERDAEIARLRDALDKPFCVLFLDGRNEHGSHVLTSYPQSFEIVDTDVDEQAEAILVAAEAAGFQIGQHVWAEFSYQPDQVGDFGRIDFAGYWDFSGINVEMSQYINARAALAKEQADA